MKNVIILFMLALLGVSTQAQEKKNKNAKYTVAINGNCEHCKKRIEKAAFSVSGVKSANWSIETHQLVLILNEEKTSIFDLETAVAKVGHDSKDVKAEKEVYDKLPACCLYVRE